MGRLGDRALDTIGIVGIGLIGGSIALAARRASPDLRLIGVDHGPAVDGAAALGAFDSVASDLAALERADLIVLSAPVRQNGGILRDLASGHPAPAVITDTGSTKRVMLEASRALPAHLSFVGGHPLAGAARAGAAAARGDLFRGRPWLLTPGDTTRSLADVEFVASFASMLGADPHILDADVHDRVIAFLSHLPQLTASALMDVVGRAVGIDYLALAGAGLADTTRLAASPADIWRDICATNEDAIGPAIDVLIGTLQRLRADLPHGAAILEVFESAARWRAAVETASDAQPATGQLP